MARPTHWNQPTTKYEVSHPALSGSVNLDIITSKKKSADRYSGATADSAQKFIVMQFKAAYSEKFGQNIRSMWINYEDLNFRLIQSKPEPATRHCCGDDRCTQCDLGYHERCRRGCTLV